MNQLMNVSTLESTKVGRVTLDIKGASELIGVSTSTMYTLVRENQIPHKKVRGRILFHCDTVEAWLRGDHQEPKRA